MIVTQIDTACCLIEIGDIKILTDPVLDKAGKLYHHGYGAFSRKIGNPTLDDTTLEGVNLILLSHPQHKDNFDRQGREFAKSVPLILSTQKIQKSYSNGKGLKPWEFFEYSEPDKNTRLKITAMPAQHHPNWLPKFISGEVIGFYIETDLSEETLYISGDTVYFDGINQIAERITPTYSLIHVGSAEFRYLTGGGKFTMDARGFIQTVKTINPTLAIPIHNDGWSHFKEDDRGILMQLSKENEEFRNKIHFLKNGERDDLKLRLIKPIGNNL